MMSQTMLLAWILAKTASTHLSSRGLEKESGKAEMVIGYTNHDSQQEQRQSTRAPEGRGERIRLQFRLSLT
jgi:hypothetical protein